MCLCLLLWLSFRLPFFILLLYFFIELPVVLVVEVTVEHSYLVFIHEQLLDASIFWTALNRQPVVAVGEIHVLVGNAHNLLVCLPPVAGLVLDLDLDDFGCVLL